VNYQTALAAVDFWRSLGAGICWVVVGGESGGLARPFDLAWARRTIAQCRDAGVPVFGKQLGTRPFETVCGLSRHVRPDIHVPA